MPNDDRAKWRSCGTAKIFMCDSCFDARSTAICVIIAAMTRELLRVDRVHSTAYRSLVGAAVVDPLLVLNTRIIDHMHMTVEVASAMHTTKEFLVRQATND